MTKTKHSKININPIAEFRKPIKIKMEENPKNKKKVELDMEKLFKVIADLGFIPLGINYEKPSSQQVP